MPQGRPSKSAKLLHPCSQTKDEINSRIIHEEKLKGSADELKPSSRLNSNQKKIFNYITRNLEASGLLGNLDLHILETTVIAIDRLQNIEAMINKDFDKMFDRELMNTKSKYTTDFMKGIEHLSLSPSARAKFGIMAVEKKKQEQDPLLKILKRPAN